jgi:hypothetical protein
MPSAHVIRSRIFTNVMANALYTALVAFAFVFVLIVTWGIHP